MLRRSSNKNRKTAPHRKNRTAGSGIVLAFGSLPVADTLQHPVPMDFIRISQAVVFPVTRVGFEPFLPAEFLARPILRIMRDLLALPDSLPFCPAFFLSSSLVDHGCGEENIYRNPDRESLPWHTSSPIQSAETRAYSPSRKKIGYKNDEGEVKGRK